MLLTARLSNCLVAVPLSGLCFGRVFSIFAATGILFIQYHTPTFSLCGIILEVCPNVNLHFPTRTQCCCHVRFPSLCSMLSELLQPLQSVWKLHVGGHCWVCVHGWAVRGWGQWKKVILHHTPWPAFLVAWSLWPRLHWFLSGVLHSPLTI